MKKMSLKILKRYKREKEKKINYLDKRFCRRDTGEKGRETEGFWSGLVLGFKNINSVCDLITLLILHIQ